MLKRLEIENFQSHKDTILEFSPGVNLITGESDNGKSALLRAIYWAAMNKPAGKDFVNWDNENAVAAVTIENDNHVVCRMIGDNINSYFLDDTDNELTGFGKHGIPEVVKTALKINDINFQRQQDTFFLLDKSPAEIGRYLNSIINLEVIDSSLTHAGGRVRAATADKTRLEAELEELQKQIKEDDWIDDFTAGLAVAERTEKELELKKWRYKKVKTAADQLQEQKQIETECKKITKFKQRLTAIEKQDQKIESIITKYNALDTVVTSLEQEHKRIQTSKKVLAFKDKMKVVVAAQQQLNDIKATTKNLRKLVETIDASRIDCFRIKGVLDELTKEFNALMPDICPLCGGELDN